MVSHELPGEPDHYTDVAAGFYQADQTGQTGPAEINRRGFARLLALGATIVAGPNLTGCGDGNNGSNENLEQADNFGYKGQPADINPRYDLQAEAAGDLISQTALIQTEGLAILAKVRKGILSRDLDLTTRRIVWTDQEPESEEAEQAIANVDNPTYPGYSIIFDPNAGSGMLTAQQVYTQREPDGKNGDRQRTFLTRVTATFVLDNSGGLPPEDVYMSDIRKWVEDDRLDTTGFTNYRGVHLEGPEGGTKVIRKTVGVGGSAGNPVLKIITHNLPSDEPDPVATAVKNSAYIRSLLG